MKKRIAPLLALLVCLTSFGGALAEISFDGSVVSRGAEIVRAPFGGTLSAVFVRAGERIEAGDVVAEVETTKVYAPADGTVSGLFIQTGDSAESAAARYGAALFIASDRKYSIVADIEKAYNASANKYVHIGETVYIACTSDATHIAEGVIVAAEGTGYTVETTSGELMMEETVNIYRRSERDSESRIGRGTVSRTAELAVDAAGGVVAIHVSEGERVERGQLLFETVNGGLDGLYASGSAIASGAGGVVASVAAEAGSAINKGDALLSVYPDDSLEIEISVEEYDLPGIAVGDKVRIRFDWDEDGEHDATGRVRAISYLPASAETAAGANGAASANADSTDAGSASYSAYIDFTPDESARLGMSVSVSVLEADAEGASAE